MIWIIFYKKNALNTNRKSSKEKGKKEENNKDLWIKMFESSIHNYISDFFDVKDLVSLLLMNSKENLKLKSIEFNKLVEDNRIEEFMKPYTRTFIIHDGMIDNEDTIIIKDKLQNVLESFIEIMELREEDLWDKQI